MDAEGRGQLIPDLPEDLVLAHIVPRLPWFTRPLCRALSKSWRTLLDTRNADLDLRTRMIQLPALRGLFLICTFDKHIFIRDPDIHDPWQTKTYRIQPHWRKLPPLGVPFLSLTDIVASSGMVYVWARYHQGQNFVLKLDMGCAEWTWKKLHISRPFRSRTISFNDKLYVPLLPKKTDSPLQQYGVLVHDMITDKCKEVETRNPSNIRVLSKCGQANVRIEEMYNLVGHRRSPNLKVLMYEAESDSWRIQEKVPIPTKMRRPTRGSLKLLNSDCFEPTPERGINILVECSAKSFFWFNSYVQMAWVEIVFNPSMEGRYLDHLEYIRGSLYGIFIDKREEEEDTGKDEDGGGILGLSKRIIMKGRVIVASKIVAWEDVHEVGFFQGCNRLEFQPIVRYTFLA